MTWDAPESGRGKRRQSTTYEVHRALIGLSSARGRPRYIGATGYRRFVDADIPFGLMGIEYQVIARRNGHRVASHPTCIMFGNTREPARTPLAS